jgi:pimeloyl-ACP methyl ester carboxylesterase
MVMRIVVMVTRMVVMVVLVVGTLAAPGTAGSSRGHGEPRLVDRECGLLIPSTARADCYWLPVPESRDGSARSRRTELRLAVMVLHARTRNPEPDPVVFLAGGPGEDAISGFENFLDSPMLEDRDLVLLDQRGAGSSEPSLNCPEREEAERVDFSRPEPHEVELEALRAATQECRDRLIEEGVNLDAFDTRESAADVADLRIALDVDEWNLYGVSYGTRLALEVMRSHPDGIRSVVLDSVYPPDVTDIQSYVDGVEAAFDRLVVACNADASCAVQQADLDQLLDTMVTRYNDTPETFTASTGDELSVTGDDVLAGLWNAMYDSELIPTLPAAIEALATGDPSLLQVLAEEAPFGLSAEGMFISVECADNGGSQADDPGRASVVVRYAAQPYCDLWDVERLPRAFNRLVRSRIPTLVLAGSLDPITPASDSKRVAAALRSSTYVELAGLGHVVTIPSDCARAIRQEFLGDPSRTPDTSCAEAPPPPFLSQGLI